MIKHALLLTTMIIGSSAMLGCGGGGEELVKAAQKYETDSCACKDVACTTKAAQDYTKTTQDLAGKKLVASEDDAKKITTATTKATECVTKLAMSAVPGGMPAMPAAK